MMKKISYYLLLILLSINIMPVCSATLSQKNESEVFKIDRPDYKKSPLTGMTRRHWVDAGIYLLDGAFSYVHTIDDPMIFPKNLEKCYPRSEKQVPTAKLEGLCRTLLVAAPMLREKPDLVLNGINVAEYYRHQLLQLINPKSQSFIKPRAKNGGPSQILVEFGALAISLFTAPEILWDPLAPAQKQQLAKTMLSYADGPTVASNWRFFNIFILSFFKEQGYQVNEKLMREYLDKSLAMYRGEGWYNDAPAYDYYSMWAFQMYGPLWAHFYGKKHMPDLAEKFLHNLHDTKDNYPYLFNKDGKMMMWGRSISYRYCATVPLVLLGLTGDKTVNYGWMRRIASSSLLQFLQHPDFLEDRVPTLGFYGSFAPAVQIYSCRGSVYWSGKVFLSLLLPEDDPFWTTPENNGAWEKELKKGKVYNKFQPASTLMITDYPNSGSTEMRSWCHEKVSTDWQKFRSSENYNKLAYHSDLLWMADGENGEVSMNYAVRNAKNEWEVLRLYTFQEFKEGIYRRKAVLETDSNVQFQLAEIPLPDGVLRIDKLTSSTPLQVRLGHYSLARFDAEVTETQKVLDNCTAHILSNGRYQVAQIPLSGWQNVQALSVDGLHPEAKTCKVLISNDNMKDSKIYVTLQLWKKGVKPFTQKELKPVKTVKVSPDGKLVEVLFMDKTQRVIEFN